MFFQIQRYENRKYKLLTKFRCAYKAQLQKNCQITRLCNISLKRNDKENVEYNNESFESVTNFEADINQYSKK